jgi:hypothetical protein
MAIGSGKVGVMGGRIPVPAGSETFNSPGTFTALDIQTVTVTGRGGYGSGGSAGNPGNAGNPAPGYTGNPGGGGGGGGGGGAIDNRVADLAFQVVSRRFW